MTKKAVYLLVGGGTGGHITPLQPVASQLKLNQPDSRVVYIGQRGDRFSSIMSNYEQVDASYMIYAGKYRRYPGMSLFRRLLDLSTLLLNIRDIFYIGFGAVQALRILIRERPKAVLLKGGFVGVPVALACVATKTPYATHDSDALAGLANRLASRKATKMLVADAVELYPYPAARTVQVGLPVSDSLKNVAELSQQGRTLFSELELNDDVLTILVSGGSQGARTINNATIDALKHLGSEARLQVIIIAGDAHRQETQRLVDSHIDQTGSLSVAVMGFTDKLYALMAQSDLLVTRASATTVYEAATLNLPQVLIPSVNLLDQKHNARIHSEQDRAIVLHETDQLAAELGQIMLELSGGDKARFERLAVRMKDTLIGSNTDAAVAVAEQLRQIGGADA